MTSWGVGADVHKPQEKGQEPERLEQRSTCHIAHVRKNAGCDQHVPSEVCVSHTQLGSTDAPSILLPTQTTNQLLRANELLLTQVHTLLKLALLLVGSFELSLQLSQLILDRLQREVATRREQGITV